MSDGRLEESTQEWVEDTLELLDMAEWDRFVTGNGPDAHGEYINVYGWIERENDEYKDFVQLRFFPESDLYGFTTSSDRYTDEIHRRMFDAEPDDHNDCRRVEHTFDVDNAIELGDQTTLTDGGTTTSDSERCFLCGYRREKHERLCLYARKDLWNDVRKLRTGAFGRSVDTDTGP